MVHITEKISIPAPRRVDWIERGIIMTPGMKEIGLVGEKHLLVYFNRPHVDIASVPHSQVTTLGFVMS